MTSPDRIERAIGAALRVLYGDGQGGYGATARSEAEKHVRLHIAIARELRRHPVSDADEALEVFVRQMSGDAS